MDKTRKRLNIWRFPYKFTPGRILGMHPSYLPGVDAYTLKVFLPRPLAAIPEEKSVLNRN